MGGHDGSGVSIGALEKGDKFWVERIEIVGDVGQPQGVGRYAFVSSDLEGNQTDDSGFFREPRGLQKEPGSPLPR